MPRRRGPRGRPPGRPRGGGRNRGRGDAGHIYSERQPSEIPNPNDTVNASPGGMDDVRDRDQGPRSEERTGRRNSVDTYRSRSRSPAESRHTRQRSVARSQDSRAANAADSRNAQPPGASRARSSRARSSVNSQHPQNLALPPTPGGANSTVNRKRRLELAAAEERAKIRKISLMAQEQVDIEIINQRLQVELAELEEQARERTPSDHRRTLSPRSSCTAESRTREWVRSNIENRHSEPRATSQVADESTSRGIERLASAITHAMERAQEKVCNNDANQRLVTRLTTSRDLPSFDGDPLEWPRFKRAFESSTELGGYSEDENVARLARCLRKEARDAVSSLMIGPAKLSQIMDTLQLRFGNPELVAQKIGKEIKRLPRLDSERGNLTVFATTIKNCVTAMESLGHLGYLHSPELHAEIVDKIPASMIRGYNLFYHERKDTNTPKLAVLADYLRFEADIACAAGTTDAAGRAARPERPKITPKTKYDERPRRAIILNTSGENSRQRNPKRDNAREDRCGFCENRGHATPACNKFAALPIRRRWRWASENRVCFRCFKSDHRQDACRAERCQHPGCTGSHHNLLHTEKRARSPARQSAEPTTQKKKATNHAVNNTWAEEGRRVLLKIAPVRLWGPKGSTSTYALLDEGSTITLLDNELADKIGATGETVGLDLHGVSEMCTKIPSSRRIEFRISGATTGSRKHSISGARTVPDLRIHCQSLSSDDIKNNEHLKHLDLPLYDNAVPKLLIGQDHWDLLTPTEIRAGPRHAPVATNTQLGWVVHGYATAASSQNRRQKTLKTTEDSSEPAGGEENSSRADRELHNLVKASFAVDAIGVTTGSRKNARDQRAEEIMARTARRVGDRWEIGLLWKLDGVRLPDSYPNALNRLQSLERKMSREPAFGAAYRLQIQDLLTNGYARKLSSAPCHERTWFLPHFGVTNPNKPGKLRIVFDAAAKTQGTSLNDYLLAGPDLLNSLLGVLMRFREKPVAFTADIKQMFLQIKIREEDRNSQLFLWRDGDSHKDPDVYQMTSLIFGASSSPATALYIKNTNARSFEANLPKAAEAIIRKHYMDDYLDSVSSVEEARTMIADVTHIQRQGGFEIRGWTSNKPEVLQEIPEDRRSRGAVDLSLIKEDGERTLGLIWKPLDDTLSFATSFARIPQEILAGSRRPTKREMLRVVMSVFDPIGLLAPFTVGSKIMLKNVWQSGIGWDDRLADAEFSDWLRWVERLREVALCVVPRCYLSSKGNPATTELHIFCDASEQAYAAVGYWRFTYGDNDHRLAFIASKTRVAPLRAPLSIPRMELQAALLGSRLANTITMEHDIKISQRIFWSDARAVLCWIKFDSRRHNAWVSNRLGEIDETTNASEWRWVPSKENPADEATRSKANVPSSESRWFKGPQFLTTHESSWPKVVLRREDYDGSEDVRTEMSAHVTVNTSRALPDLKRFSSWTRLIRTTARVLLFLEVRLKKAQPEVTVSHLQHAEDLWVLHAQRESFGTELRTLEEGGQIAKTSRLLQLSPIIDEKGILRVKGRIRLVEGVETDAKTPVILDGRHPYTKLLVMDYHQRAGHGSTETVLNELRQRYWIVRSRPTIRSVASSCQWCRVQKAKPHPPLMGDLPTARLSHHQRPFTRCGVDYFGPMTVTIGRRHEKRWGVLFTCLTTRAVHLELAASLSTDSAIMALHRFSARRGYPSELWSDNGTNFRGAATELRHAIESLDVDKLKLEAVNNRMTWRFIPPSTPHMGGSWERLIRSVKVALTTTLQGQAPREETLSTALAEAEHSVNSRPLGPVSADPRDPEALTPNHFLIGTSSRAALPIRSTEDDLSCRKQWRIAQRLADVFWHRWLKEYLPTLQIRRKWNVDVDPIREGDVVFLMETNTPRNTWNRGVVTKVFPGADGRTRVAEVRSGTKTYIRAAAKLILLVPGKDGTDETTSIPAGRMSPTE